jgi:hypothetical protein
MKKENAQRGAQSIPMQEQYNILTVFIHSHVRCCLALKPITAIQ